ncbi:methyltransferase domain-containing protein [Geomonas paludis]|uniref:Methyltransferase domain-containing protein n=1 Tax=Geomonas paludis TaxID=2740185 RepID=A0ABY4LIS4_9BACT|nr:methyltransferase domain-containing protein [Geomonas paludis]UPU37639.1 methyltransferase domain-containing protein [Geomonas paludis]
MSAAQGSARRVLLNLGCGVRTNPEWVNIDWSLKLRLSRLPLVRRLVSCPGGVMIHDLRKGIPFADGSVDAVYSSHVLEHLMREHAALFLKEMFRVLKPGGTVRIVVPDLEAAARNYLQALERVRLGAPDRETRDDYEWSTILLLDQMVRTRAGGEMASWLSENHDSPVVASFVGTLREIAGSLAPGRVERGVKARLAALMRPSDPAKSGELHRWMYDAYSLRGLMEGAGFREVTACTHLDSRIDGWQGFWLDNNADGTPHQPDSVWMEGVRP